MKSTPSEIKKSSTWRTAAEPESDACDVRPEKEYENGFVLHYICRQDSIIDAQEKFLSILEERLLPVLTDVLKAEDRCDKAEARAVCQVAQRLETSVIRMTRLSERIAELTSRVAI